MRWPQFADRQPFRLEHEIGNQLILTGGIGASGNRGLAHGGMQGQRRLDFRGLDAVAANLDLIVDPAQELQRPVGPPPRPVAGPKQSGARVLAERMRDEALFGLLRPFR